LVATLAWFAESPAQDAPRSAAEEVPAIQAGYRAEREAVVKSGAAKRFLPQLFTRAEEMARRADAALAAGRLLQAVEAFRQARWQLPYEGPHVPGHVVRVFGQLRLRHADEINAVAFSPDGTRLASAGGNPLQCRDRSVRVWDLANGH